MTTTDLKQQSIDAIAKAMHTAGLLLHETSVERDGCNMRTNGYNPVAHDMFIDYLEELKRVVRIYEMNLPVLEEIRDNYGVKER